MTKLFEPNFRSLRTYQCPDWFRDVKFGIWSHWGPQSVPMFGDWYARNMYIEGTPQYCYHLRHYGHPSEFGYKDICRLWKAESFDPMGLMKLYHDAGARYFVGQAMHHDHFFNYPSEINRFNSMQVGPMKDICGLWKQAADQYGMRFGLTEHLGASFSWWACNKGADRSGPYKGVPYDGNDPEYRDFYFDNDAHYDRENSEIKRWYTGDEAYHDYWLRVIKEVIDRYEPDLLYTDGGLPFVNTGDMKDPRDPASPADNPVYQKGLEAVSYLYNRSIQKHGRNEAVYNQKDRDADIYSIGVLDIEKSQLPDILPQPWQTDTCIGNWFYDVHSPYKSPAQIAEMLVDIIAKNGTMLLNILQRPDGTIDSEAEYILRELAKWFAVCAEGVYETRPWKVSGEGDTKVLIQGFTEEKTEWNSSDFRFVQKNGDVYAFVLKTPENRVAILKSFADEPVKAVTLLGRGPVPFRYEYGVLIVQLPEEMPVSFANCLKISLQ